MRDGERFVRIYPERGSRERETKPLVCRLPSYIKDTTDFLNKLASLNSLPHNVLFVSLDVTSLYTNIPQNEGINASRSFLQKRANPRIPSETVCDPYLVHVKQMDSLLSRGQMEI